MIINNKIKTNMCILFVLTFILVYNVNGKCQNMLQKSGQCTKCPSSKFLYKGDCYSKIRGCLDYFSNKICLSCQSGYVFNEGACIKEAIFYKIQKNDIPPVKINIEGSLSFNDIQQRIGQSRKQMFELINRYFKQTYVKNLNTCTINNVKYIQTINGVIFTIFYRSFMHIYQAIAFIDSKRDSKHKKNQRTSIPTYSLEQINSGILKKYEQTLKNCLLSSVKKIDSNKFKFSYVNFKGQKYECFIKREPFEQIQDLKNVINPIDLEDVLAVVFNMYPQLKQMDFEIVSAPYFQNKQTVQGIYVLIFEQKFQIKIQNNKGVFNLLSYKNLQIQKEQSQKDQINHKESQKKNDQQQKQQYKPFEDLTDPVLLEVWRHFITQYPKYQNYQISNVQHKRNSGRKFLIKAKTPKNLPLKNIKISVNYPLNNPIQLQSLQIDSQHVNLLPNNYKQQNDKNNALEKIVRSNPDYNIKQYDFRSDEEFTESYRYMLNKIKIVNVIPIINVNRVQTEQHVDYQIVYGDKEKAKIRKSKSVKSKYSNIHGTNKYLRRGSPQIVDNIQRNDIQVVYYIIDGKDLVSGKIILDQPRQTSLKTRIIQTILKQKSQVFSTNYLIQSYKQLQPTNGKREVTLNILTPTGSYQIIVDAKQKQNIRMISLINTSPDNCYEFIETDLHSNKDQNGEENQFIKIDKFLKSNYGLNDAVFQLIQAEVTQKAKRFRILYTDHKKRKLDILLQSYQGKYIIIESLILQQSYMPIEQDDKQIASIEGLSKAHFSQFLQNCQIRLRLTNSTHYKLVYSCKNKAFQYLYDSTTQKDKLQIIFKRNESRDHQVSLNKDKLISLKQIVNDFRFTQIDKQSRNKFSQYIQKSQITSIQKDQVAGVQGKVFYLYKIYYKTSLGGHYICQSSWSDGQIKILNFYLATLQMNTNCQILAQQTSKECIQCLQGYYMDHGKCYKTIEYCQVQIGDLCVRCDSKSVLKDGKCIRSCKNIFSIRTKKELEM